MLLFTPNIYHAYIHTHQLKFNILNGFLFQLLKKNSVSHSKHVTSTSVDMK
jgi:hypothetical protein